MSDVKMNDPQQMHIIMYNLRETGIHFSDNRWIREAFVPQQPLFGIHESFVFDASNSSVDARLCPSKSYFFKSFFYFLQDARYVAKEINPKYKQPYEDDEAEEMRKRFVEKMTKMQEQQAVHTAAETLSVTDPSTIAMIQSMYRFALLRHEMELLKPQAATLLTPSKKCHFNVGCDECNMFPIMGKRYHCDACSPSYDLCDTCFSKTSHTHLFKLDE